MPLPSLDSLPDESADFYNTMIVKVTYLKHSGIPTVLQVGSKRTFKTSRSSDFCLDCHVMKKARNIFLEQHVRKWQYGCFDFAFRE
jgi:hypothetical protein